jgi:hypothetical protein
MDYQAGIVVQLPDTDPLLARVTTATLTSTTAVLYPQ